MSAFPDDCTALDAWALTHVAGYSAPAHARKFDTGQSNPTYLVDTQAQRYVLRRKPPGKLLKSAHAVDREFRVLGALHGVGFPVPRPLALCEGENIIGSMFYLMQHVAGRIFWDPALPGLAPNERTAIYDAMNVALARLHSVDIAAVGLADYGRPGSYFARQLQRWTEQYRASETSAMPDMDRLIEWLGAHVPADDGRIALVHGDWRIDNMIFASDAPRLLAVLDWNSRRSGIPMPISRINACSGACRTPANFAGWRGSSAARLAFPRRLITSRTIASAWACRQFPTGRFSSRLASFASRRSSKASTSGRSTATPPIRSAPAEWARPCR